MELKLYEDQSSLALVPVRDKGIIEALRSRMFKDVPDVEAYNIVKDVITRCYVSARYESPVADELQIISDETMKVIKANFPSLREKEFAIACTNGLIGEYGEYHGLSLPTFTKFVRSYIKESTRVKLTTPVQEEKPIPSEKEIYQLSRKNAVDSFKEFIETGTVGRYAVIVYDFLDKMDILKLDVKSKKEIFTDAQKEYVTSLKASLNAALDRGTKQKYQADFDSYLRGDKNDAVKIVAKRLSLENYFASLLLDDKILSDIIPETC